MADDLIETADALTSFLKFADDMREIHERYNRPAWAETCSCGATTEVAKDVPNAERARIYRNWIGRHLNCPPGRHAEALGVQP